MKIRLVGAELLSTDGRTFMLKPIVAFRNFANAPKIDGNKVRIKPGTCDIRTVPFLIFYI